MTKISKDFITDKILTGLQHYLTDQTSYGRYEDGLLDTRIDITRVGGSEIEIVVKPEGKQARVFLIEIAEET